MMLGQGCVEAMGFKPDETVALSINMDILKPAHAKYHLYGDLKHTLVVFGGLTRSNAQRDRRAKHSI